MKTILTSELIDNALDWAVASIEQNCTHFDLTDDERYCTNWAHGGPLIEREKIELKPLIYEQQELWGAAKANSSMQRHIETGPTPLVAAMRCFVLSRLGEKVDIPDDLIELPTKSAILASSGLPVIDVPLAKVDPEDIKGFPAVQTRVE